MRLIRKFQDFESTHNRDKESQKEKPQQKSDSQIKPERRTDDKSKQGPSLVVTIPNWKNY